jgi:hypothetical protein
MPVEIIGEFGPPGASRQWISLPYRQLNPNAPANWLADIEKWREDLGVTSEHLSYEMGFLECQGLVRICRHIGDSQCHD